MALPALTADEQKAALEGAAADLKFLLDREEVDLDIQGRLFHAGLNTTARFASSVKDSEDMKLFARQALGLDFAATIPERLRVTKLIVAWKQAQVRVDKRAEADAEADSSRLRKTLPTSDFQAMREAFFRKWWPLEESLIPSRYYLEKKMEGIEVDEPRAELLSEVVSHSEEDQESVAPVYVASTGTFKFQRDTQQVPLPANPEQLRRRIKVLGNALMFIGLRYSNRIWLQDLTPQIFEEYLSYLLGEHVYGMNSKDSSGRVLSAPAWTHILGYEHSIRKKMVRLVIQDKFKLCDALRKAWEDPVVKERFFNTPVAHSAVHNMEAPEERPNKAAKVDTKGGSKGDGKGNKNQGKLKEGKGGKAKKPRCPAKAPDGSNICFRYNTGKCKAKNCQFSHICGVCFQAGHPMGHEKCKGPTNSPAGGVGETKVA